MNTIPPLDEMAIDDADITETPYEAIGERKVLIQQYDYAVRTLMDMIVEGDIKLDPDYQRNYRWADEKASKFIESIALNIPVPVIYMAEEADASFTIIDGQQRLTSLFRYFKPTELSTIFPDKDIQELVLDKLKIRHDLNGKNFLQLGREDKSVLAKRPIRCIVILNESDSTLKFEVFERLNTGSASLTDQEVRNCIYRGSFNKLIKDLSQNEKFKKLIALPEKFRHTMKDAELILRFFAYSTLTESRSYPDNYTEYLNDHMNENREISSDSMMKFRKIFEETIDIIYDTLGCNTAFRKPLDRNAPSTFTRTAINGAIYESQMIAVSRLVEKNLSVPSDLKERILSSFRDDNYWEALFQGTSKKAKALNRSRILTDLVLR